MHRKQAKDSSAVRSVTISARVSTQVHERLLAEVRLRHTTISKLITDLCEKRALRKAHPATAAMAQLITTLRTVERRETPDPALIDALRDNVKLLARLVVKELK